MSAAARTSVVRSFVYFTLIDDDDSIQLEVSLLARSNLDEYSMVDNI
jgi:hypothetical protein